MSNNSPFLCQNHWKRYYMFGYTIFTCVFLFIQFIQALSLFSIYIGYTARYDMIVSFCWCCWYTYICESIIYIYTRTRIYSPKMHIYKWCIDCSTAHCKRVKRFLWITHICKYTSKYIELYIPYNTYTI